MGIVTKFSRRTRSMVPGRDRAGRSPAELPYALHYDLHGGERVEGNLTQRPARTTPPSTVAPACDRQGHRPELQDYRGEQDQDLSGCCPSVASTMKSILHLNVPRNRQAGLDSATTPNGADRTTENNVTPGSAARTSTSRPASGGPRRHQHADTTATTAAPVTCGTYPALIWGRSSRSSRSTPSQGRRGRTGASRARGSSSSTSSPIGTRALRPRLSRLRPPRSAVAEVAGVDTPAPPLRVVSGWCDRRHQRRHRRYCSLATRVADRARGRRWSTGGRHDFCPAMHSARHPRPSDPDPGPRP